MPGMKFDRQPPNQPIKVGTLNNPIEEVERLSGLTVSAPLEMTKGAAGTHLRLSSMARYDARITTAGVVVGTSAKYGWQAVFADVTSPGTWIDMDSSISGTTTVDPAWERNGNASLPIGTRVLIERDYVSNQLLFSYGKCP